MDDNLDVDLTWLPRFATNARLPSCHQYARGNASTWLRDAANEGGIHRVRRCLAAGANPTHPDEDGKIPLVQLRSLLGAKVLYYIFCVHEEILRALTKCLGRTPRQIEIFGVVTHKKARKFRFLVNRRTDIVCAKFMEAVETGDLKTVRSMVEGDEIGVNAVSILTGESAVAVALARQEVQVAKYLLGKGAYPDISTFPVAVRCRDVDLVRQIACCWDAVPRELCIPALDAASTGSVEMIETLMELDVHLTSSAPLLPSTHRYMQHAFFCVQGSSRREKTLWLLLCAACWLQDKCLFQDLRRTQIELQDFVARRENMAVLFTLAVYREDEDLVHELLEKDVSVNHNFGATAMMAAVAVNSTRMLRLLLDRGGDVSQTYGSITPHRVNTSLLVVAAHANAADCIRVLLPLETRPLFREAALQEASAQGHVEIMDLLMDECAMFAKERRQHFCTQLTTCPLAADLLFTRCWCQGDYPMSELQRRFLSRCSCDSDPDLLSVYVAHGVDVTYLYEPRSTDGANTTSSLMKRALQASNGRPALPVVEFLLQNGLPSVSVKRERHQSRP